MLLNKLVVLASKNIKTWDQTLGVVTSLNCTCAYGKEMLPSNKEEYPGFIYTGIVNWVNTLTTYVLEYLTGWIP